MTPPKSFIRAWYDWRHLPAIPESHHGTSLDTVLLDLDHMWSHIYSLGLAAMEGNCSYISVRAEEAMAELDVLNSELEAHSAAEEIKESVRKFIAPTRSLLLEMSKLSNEPL